ncbi:glycosyltransferase family 9 protein [Agarivorans sp. MS3-6]
MNFIIGKYLFDKSVDKFDVSTPIKSLLLIRGDGKIGDSIVSSFLYREIKKHQPELNIGVLCTANSQHLFNNDPFIDQVHCYPKRPKLWQVSRLIGALPHYDAVVFLPEVLKARDFLMLRCLKARANVGVAKNVALINCNIAEKVSGQHSQQYFVEAAKQLGIDVEDLSYRFNLSQAIEDDILAFLGDKKGRYIALNAFGNTQKRSFSEARLREVIAALRDEFPQYPLVILSSPVTQKLVNKVVAEVDHVFCLSNTTTVEQNAALIKFSQLFVSVDTATVHLAHCFNTPMVAIYRQDPENFAMWAPNYQPTKAIFARAAVNKLEEVNVGEFDLNELLLKINDLLQNTQ